MLLALLHKPPYSEEYHVLCSAAIVLKFLMFFDQRAPYFYFALRLTNDVANTGFKISIISRVTSMLYSTKDGTAWQKLKDETKWYIQN